MYCLLIKKLETKNSTFLFEAESFKEKESWIGAFGSDHIGKVIVGPSSKINPNEDYLDQI